MLVRSLKHYTKENFKDTMKKIYFPDYLKYTCLNDAYSNFVKEFVAIINSVAPIKKVRVKVNSKPWFDAKIISVIQIKRQTIFRYKNLGLEMVTDNFNPSPPKKLL